ncbi:hypothetical protein AVEN_231027-1 [Araneus ventricosus]|uniref:RNase H type-1 domain-containing protein n=1 Tax=Araneus ventricosus TaxID=182803 RepID=A0A4Y2A4E9_ARAVE|nr:hypothetical protein AVEN_231027-1 [Araneus ventricosus]
MVSNNCTTKIDRPSERARDFRSNEAKLVAINFAAGWALERNVKIKGFSDSKSSIEAIRSSKVKSNFVLSVKDNLYNAKDLVSLVWVKAHVGNPGNELADHFAKIASSCGADMSRPSPYSYVKRACKEFLMNEWNSYWKNSTTGLNVQKKVFR